MVDSYTLYKLSQYYPGDTMQEIFEATEAIEKLAFDFTEEYNLTKAASEDYASHDFVKQAMFEELIRAGLQKNAKFLQKIKGAFKGKPPVKIESEVDRLARGTIKKRNLTPLEQKELSQISAGKGIRTNAPELRPGGPKGQR